MRRPCRKMSHEEMKPQMNADGKKARIVSCFICVHLRFPFLLLDGAIIG
jgi:hypothetical protein